jgi:site-specific recombinase XerD
VHASLDKLFSPLELTRALLPECHVSRDAGYQRMVARAGVAARFPLLIRSHMLRHSTGYKLANDGHDTRAIQGYLGHRSIVSTQRYTALAPDRFKRFWKD